MNDDDDDDDREDDRMRLPENDDNSNSDDDIIIDHSQYPPLEHRNELHHKFSLNRQQLPANFYRLLDPTLTNDDVDGMDNDNNNATAEDIRGDLFAAEDEDTMNRYAWAIPDERALKICHSFAPLVEMGAGAGYWARCLREYYQTPIVCYDKRVGHGDNADDDRNNSGDNTENDDRNTTCKRRKSTADDDDDDTKMPSTTPDDGNNNDMDAEAVLAAGVPQAPYTKIRQGGPKILHRYPHATLLLIYPDDHEAYEQPQPCNNNNNDNDDDNDSATDNNNNNMQNLPLSVACLQAYSGDTIIHVGEWMGSTLCMSMEGQQTFDQPYPWGRSTSPDFQILLSASFHCILQVELPNWGTVRNILSVWKRTPSVILDGDRYAYIPPEARLCPDMAAPSTLHLLKK